MNIINTVGFRPKKASICLLKNSKESELRIKISNLFYSITADVSRRLSLSIIAIMLV